MVVSSYPRSRSSPSALSRMSAFVCSPFTVLVDFVFATEFICLPRHSGLLADLITMLGNQRHNSPRGRQQLRRRQPVRPFAVTRQRPHNHQPCLGTNIYCAFIANCGVIFASQIMVELWITAARGVRLNWDHLEFDQLRLLGQPPVDSTAQSTRRVKIGRASCRE